MTSSVTCLKGRLAKVCPEKQKFNEPYASATKNPATVNRLYTDGNPSRVPIVSGVPADR